MVLPLEPEPELAIEVLRETDEEAESARETPEPEGEGAYHACFTLRLLSRPKGLGAA